MSEEKVLTLRGKRAVWAPGGGSGPIDPKRLPEGYPYKEGVTIEWDGNTEGKTSVTAEGIEYYWVSPEVLTDEEIKKGTSFTNDGSFVEIGKYWEHFEVGEYVTEDATYAQTAVFVRKANAEVGGAVFSTPGVYLMWDGESMFVSKFSNETIHPMAEEFIQLTSPNGTKYQLTVADDGTLSAVQV